MTDETMEKDEIEIEEDNATPETEKESSEDQVATLKDQLLRAMAEIENVRKRAQREREETAKYAVGGFARDVLNVADNLERALGAVSDEAIEKDPALKAFVEGIKITETELLSIFEKHGIQKVSPKVGDAFDHNIHQAMLEIPTEEVDAGCIASLLQPGYILNDRLLKPALVGVAKR